MATTDTATPLQALLALYGALDQAVTGNRGAGIEATVERYLPGSTGANAGWYDELLGFLADRTGLGARTEEPPAAPDLSQALTILQGQSEPVTPPATSLTPVQLSRMVYAIGALTHLPGVYPPGEFDEQFSRTLAVALPQASPPTPLPSAGVTGPPQPPQGDELLALLRQQFQSRDDYPGVLEYAAQQGWIDPDVAAVPLCQAKPKWVRGHLCVVLTTEFESSKVSLDQVKDVIDPLNWPQCLPFFCSMEKTPDRADGWSRVLEHVSTTCPIPGTPQMVTPLKYWKGPPDDDKSAQSTAWVDYALDDDPAPGEKGDGRMVVDEGFIRMTSTVDDSTSPGVRVRTRKVAGFRNLAYFPAALVACVMGYADAGEDMVLIGVAKRAKGSSSTWTDWEPSAATGSVEQPTPPGQPADSKDRSRRAVALAVEMANECIDDMSTMGAAIAEKWATGAMPVAETMTYTAALMNRLATDPWRYLTRLRGPIPGGGK